MRVRCFVLKIRVRVKVKGADQGKCGCGLERNICVKGAGLGNFQQSLKVRSKTESNVIREAF